MSALRILVLLNGLWAIGNGLLHDGFVLAKHKGVYDRDLLRLLMDGHILLTCGVVYLFAQVLVDENRPVVLWLCAAISLSMLVYCGMIFPFLKSVVTIALNAAVLVLVIGKLLRFGA
ncbi:MAG: hypothetical protein ABI432_19015 [Flavobacteriales bacterium]